MLRKKFNFDDSKWLLVICGLYLIIELCFIPYAIFSMDDLWLAYHTDHFRHAMPYRDFAPYKTTLGYYLFVLPLFFIHGVVSQMVALKIWISIINTGFLCLTVFWLKKLYSAQAVLLPLIFIVVSSLFLTSSIDVRVDLLSYWLCLISVLFILSQQYRHAGIALAIGFLVCQKAIWYAVATDVGLLAVWLSNQRNIHYFKNIIRFNSYLVATISIYILIWSYYSSFTIVLKSIFFEAYIISHLDWYVNAREFFWSYVVVNNPGLTLLTPLVIIGLCVQGIKKNLFIILYSLIIIGFVLSCRLPFPYYSLAAIPAILISYTACFAQAPTLFFNPQRLTSLIMYACIYGVFLVGAFVILSFSAIYLLVASIPMLVIVASLYGTNRPVQQTIALCCVFLMVMIGIVFPIIRFVKYIPEYNGSYQRSMLHLISSLLTPQDNYIAGVPLLRNIEQGIPGLVHLIGPSIEYMGHPKDKLLPIMELQSLYLTPVTTMQVIEAIKAAPVKLYVDNDRFHYLPKELFVFLDTQYQHLWGSVFLYAPLIAKGREKVQVKFSGLYEIELLHPGSVYVDEHLLTNHGSIFLSRGNHSSIAAQSYRLKLKPSIDTRYLQEDYQLNQWQRTIG